MHKGETMTIREMIAETVCFVMFMAGMASIITLACVSEEIDHTIIQRRMSND